MAPIVLEIDPEPNVLEILTKCHHDHRLEIVNVDTGNFAVGLHQSNC